MITHNRIKLSLALLVSAVGLGGSVHGMNWTGKEKLYYLLDSDKKITGCLSVGMQLPDDLENLVGKNLLKTIHFLVRPESERVDLETAFSKARETGKKVTCNSAQFDVVQMIKILPIKKSEDEIGFMVRISMIRLGVAPQEQ